MRKFRLFPETQRWWSFGDYAALLALVERFKPRTVLEFGPGFSTLALVEGGAESVLAYEDDPRWLAAHRKRYAGLPVDLRAYRHADPIVLPELDGRRFDFGFVEGPRNTETRPASIRFALARCLVIACQMPTPGRCARRWRRRRKRAGIALSSALRTQPGRIQRARGDNPAMNVFVLCAGRCGSMTVARAFGHATNFTAGHETRAHLIGADRLNLSAAAHRGRQPPVVDARPALARVWRLAFYINLLRDPRATAASLRADGAPA